MIDPIALDELLPDWREDGCPLAEVPVTENLHWILSATKQRNLPHALTPPFMHNKGTYTGSLGNLCRWLAARPRSWASRSSPVSPPPKSCSTRMAG